MSGISAKITMSRDAVELLPRLAVDMRDKIIPRALRNAGKLIVTASKGRVPKGDPTDKPAQKPLHDTIGQKSGRRGTTVFEIVGPQYPAGAHGHLVERGVKPHAIRAKKAKSLVGFGIIYDFMGYASGIGGAFYGREVKHPGTKPNPFMQKAVDETAAAVDAAVIDTLTQGIEGVAGAN